MPKMCLRPWLILDSAFGAYSTPPDHLAGFKGPTSRGGKRRGGEGKGKGTRGNGEGRERVIPILLFPHFKPFQMVRTCEVTDQLDCQSVHWCIPWPFETTLMTSWWNPTTPRVGSGVPHFLAECHKKRLKQGSFNLLCFVLFAFSGLCLVSVLTVFLKYKTLADIVHYKYIFTYLLTYLLHDLNGMKKRTECHTP